MPSNKVKNVTAQPEYKGEPLDDELANGPMSKRSCTDPLCCLIFIAFIGGMIGIAAYGLSKGNPDLIGRGYDADGHMCGVDEGYEDYPYLYWPLPGIDDDYRDLTVCVKSCPQADTVGPLDCIVNTQVTACAETASGTSDTAKAASRCRNCPYN
jgi:hypothetical protein